MVDNMSVAQRSRTMSKIRSKNTKPELLLRKLLHQRGLRFSIHADWLPGTPDIVFSRQKIVVFVNGDFWHGWRFPAWEHKLAPYWHKKIANNRKKDIRNFCKLRKRGWQVIRIWEHQLKSDPELCATRIEVLIRSKQLLQTQ